METWTMLRVACLVSVCGAMAMAGCNSTPSYAEVQAIYTRSCSVGGMSCHGASGMPTGVTLRLDDAESYAQTVGVHALEVPPPGMPLIDPGNPDNSFLLHKVLGDMYQTIPACGTQANDACGVRMPMVGGLPLSPADVDTIRQWIAGGAHGS